MLVGLRLLYETISSGPVTVPLSGVSAISSISSVGVSAAITFTATSGITSVNSVSFVEFEYVTGVSATGPPISIGSTQVFNVASISNVSSVTSVIPLYTLTISGVSSSSSVTSVGSSQSISGNTSGSSISSVIPLIYEVGPGVSSTGSVSSIASISSNTTVLGINTATSLGVITPGTSYGISAVYSSSTLSSVGVSYSPTVTFTISTSTVGNVTPSYTESVSGVLSSSSIGGMLDSILENLSGVLSTSTIQSLSNQVGVPATSLSGYSSIVSLPNTLSLAGYPTSATTSVSTLSQVGITPSLIANSAGSSVGTLPVVITSITISGVLSNSSVGSVVYSDTEYCSSVLANSSVGSLISNMDYALPTVYSSTTSGSVVDNPIEYISGNSASTLISSLPYYLNGALSGVLTNSTVSSLIPSVSPASGVTEVSSSSSVTTLFGYGTLTAVNTSGSLSVTSFTPGQEINSSTITASVGYIPSHLLADVTGVSGSAQVGNILISIQYQLTHTQLTSNTGSASAVFGPSVIANTSNSAVSAVTPSYIEALLPITSIGTTGTLLDLVNESVSSVSSSISIGTMPSTRTYILNNVTGASSTTSVAANTSATATYVQGITGVGVFTVDLRDTLGSASSSTLKGVLDPDIEVVPVGTYSTASIISLDAYPSIGLTNVGASTKITYLGYISPVVGVTSTSNTGALTPEVNPTASANNGLSLTGSIHPNSVGNANSVSVLSSIASMPIGYEIGIPSSTVVSEVGGVYHDILRHLVSVGANTSVVSIYESESKYAVMTSAVGGIGIPIAGKDIPILGVISNSSVTAPGFGDYIQGISSVVVVGTLWANTYLQVEPAKVVNTSNTFNVIYESYQNIYGVLGYSAVGTFSPSTSYDILGFEARSNAYTLKVSSTVEAIKIEVPSYSGSIVSLPAVTLVGNAAIGYSDVLNYTEDLVIPLYGVQSNTTVNAFTAWNLTSVPTMDILDTLTNTGANIDIIKSVDNSNNKQRIVVGSPNKLLNIKILK